MLTAWLSDVTGNALVFSTKNEARLAVYVAFHIKTQNQKQPARIRPGINSNQSFQFCSFIKFLSLLKSRDNASYDIFPLENDLPFFFPPSRDFAASLDSVSL